MKNMPLLIAISLVTLVTGNWYSIFEPATLPKNKLYGSQTNSNVIDGILETCQFVSWSIVAGLVKVVQKDCDDTKILYGMLFLYVGFSLIYSK